ncbi:MAG: PAS domain S-box protein, partial [Bacteroidales bacterium]|nr:PAS domain S-box protein [Bacteroidales bacterium]
TYLYQWDSEKEKFRNISPKINHPYNTSINIQYNVFCIQSKDNKLFLGTNVGLWMIDRNTYDLKFMNESRDIMIKSMKFDNKGNLWMGSDVGVLRYYQGEFMRYEESDGLLSNTMSFWSIALDNENHAWFGGSRGISRWAKIVNINHKTPKPVFTKILINGENYQDRLKKSNSFAHASYLEISFVSLDYPHNRTRYQYRIASRGENWSDKISNNEFFLPKLHSGDFVLEVRAKNPGYLYSDVQSLKLKVSRPWYLTIWGVILLFLIVWIFYEIIKLVSGELKEKKYLEKLQITLYKMSREAFLKQNIENMYHTIHQVFDQVGKYDNFSVILYNNKDNSLDYVYDSDDANSKYRNPISKNLIHKLFTEKRSLMMNRDEINAHLAEIGKSYHMNEIQSWLGVPFSTDKDIFGALVVQSHHEANYFGQKEIDILEYISNHISQVIYRIRMENALEENERKLRSLINSMPEYVLFKNEEGTIEIANNAICEFLGIKDASSLIGKKYHELESILPVHMKKYLSKEIKNDEKVWNGRSIARYEGLVRNSKGEFFALDITKVPLYGHDRGRIGMVMISHDVTDRKKSENLLQGALEKANVATKTKSEFIANMSHEIRTPLNGVIGMTDMLLESKLNTTQEDYAEVIKNSA